jgi:hypothetical protein
MPSTTPARVVSLKESDVRTATWPTYVLALVLVGTTAPLNNLAYKNDLLDALFRLVESQFHKAISHLSR